MDVQNRIDVQTRDVPEQTVITLRAFPTQDELVPWVQGDAMALWQHVEALGGPTGSAFFVFHGEVKPGQASIVEYCIPVASGQEIPLSLGPRLEPAHREAYVALPASMLEFPAILQGYEAVEAWIGANGHRVSGPPRELYWIDPMTVAAGEPAFEIAFPID